MRLFRKQISKITHPWTLNLIKANQIFVYSCSLTFYFFPLLFTPPPHTHTNLLLCYKDVGSEQSWPWSYHQVPDPALTQGELLQPCCRAGTVVRARTPLQKSLQWARCGALLGQLKLCVTALDRKGPKSYCCSHVTLYIRHFWAEIILSTCHKLGL